MAVACGRTQGGDMFHAAANGVLARVFSLSNDSVHDQGRALRRILRGATRTEISRRYGLDGVRSVREYQDKCPRNHRRSEANSRQRSRLEELPSRAKQTPLRVPLEQK